MKYLLLAVGLTVTALVYSYKLLEIPDSFVSDEAAYGYNAVLLSRTAHDENGRLMPFFILSINGKDWHQPVLQYYIAALFKIFGPSTLLLRLSSIFTAVASAALLYILTSYAIGGRVALLATLFFILTPQVMIQSHLAMDNITGVPYVIIWLLAMILFKKTDRHRYLVLAALALGIGFYSYKGMRATVPVWAGLSIAYLIILNQRLSKLAKELGVFMITILPFFVIIPLLEWKYPGAVFGGSTPTLHTIYDFIYPYLASYDPSFLFIKGDTMLLHSTGRHGMLLLSSLPLFLIGCYQAIKRKGWWIFILASFLTAPLLYGLVDSVYRASRLASMIPSYVLVAALGGISLWESKNKILGRKLLVLILLLMVINWGDFVGYYWTDYRKLMATETNPIESAKAYQMLADYAEQRGLTPYVATDLYDGGEQNAKFFEAIYFDHPALKILPQNLPPTGSMLLTHRLKVPEMKLLTTVIPDYNLLIRE